MNRVLHTVLAMFFIERSRPRHAPVEVLPGASIPAPLGAPMWHPLTPSRADEARDELLAAVVYEKRRGTLPPSVHGAAIAWIEARA